MRAPLGQLIRRARGSWGKRVRLSGYFDSCCNAMAHSRTAISGLVGTTFLMLLGSSALPQEPARKGADTESGQLTFNNACRTCHTTKEGDNRLGPNLHNIIGRKAGSLPN